MPSVPGASAVVWLHGLAQNRNLPSSAGNRRNDVRCLRMRHRLRGWPAPESTLPDQPASESRRHRRSGSPRDSVLSCLPESVRGSGVRAAASASNSRHEPRTPQTAAGGHATTARHRAKVSDARHHTHCMSDSGGALPGQALERLQDRKCRPESPDCVPEASARHTRTGALTHFRGRRLRRRVPESGWVLRLRLHVECDRHSEATQH